MTNTTDRTANEMFFQIVALLLSIIIIHTIYVTVIRPNAENIINKQIRFGKYNEIYNLAAQSFVDKSFINPSERHA